MSDRLFWTLARGVAFLLVGVVLLAINVPWTFQFLPCWEGWPICGGSLFPFHLGLAPTLGWLERFFSVLLALLAPFLFVTMALAYRNQDNDTLTTASISTLLFAVQCLLVLGFRLFDLSVILMVLHMAAGVLILAAMVAAMWWNRVTQSRSLRSVATGAGLVISALAVVQSLFLLALA